MHCIIFGEPRNSLFVSVQLYRIIVICNFNIGPTPYTWVYNCFLFQFNYYTLLMILFDFQESGSGNVFVLGKSWWRGRTTNPYTGMFSTGASVHTYVHVCF